MARAIAAINPGGPATWRLYVREAQAARAVLGQRLAPVGDRWDWAARWPDGRIERVPSATKPGMWAGFARAFGCTILRRQVITTPWEEVGLDPDVREDIDLDARHEHGEEDRERDAADRGRR